MQRQANNHDSDQELVRQIAAGDEQSKAAFFTLFERYQKLTLAYTRTRVNRAEVDDVQQDVWLKVWRKINLFDGQNFRAWLLTITQRQIIDHYRKRSNRSESSMELDETTSNANSPLEMIVDQEISHVVANCLSKLDDASRQVVQRRFEGESYQQICDDLSVSETKAQKLLFHAKARLKKCIEANSP